MRVVKEEIERRKKQTARENEMNRKKANIHDYRRRDAQARGPNSSNSCNLKRIKQIRKGNARKWNPRPLDWHLKKKRRVRKKYKERRKRVWWKLRFSHTVILDIQRYRVDLDLAGLEKERDELLSLPMEVVQCNSNLGIGGAVLDSGAMRNIAVMLVGLHQVRIVADPSRRN